MARGHERNPDASIVERVPACRHAIMERRTGLKSKRMAKIVLLGVLTMGTVFQLGSCITDTLLSLGGVAFFDIFLGPLLGDTCTIIDRSTC